MQLSHMIHMSHDVNLQSSAGSGGDGAFSWASMHVSHLQNVSIKNQKQMFHFSTSTEALGLRSSVGVRKNPDDVDTSRAEDIHSGELYRASDIHNGSPSSPGENKKAMTAGQMMTDVR